MIEFTSENRPTCEPTNQAECTLNWAALQDVWDALSCLSTKEIQTGCYVYENSLPEGDLSDGIIPVLIAKEDVGDSLDQCSVEVYVNGRNAFSGDLSFDDSNYPPSYVIVDFSNDYFQINITPGEFATHDGPDDPDYTYRIKITKYDTFLDLINSCEAEINCRDL